MIHDLKRIFLYIIGRIHKHKYKQTIMKLESGRIVTAYVCSRCGDICFLEDWQIDELPGDMKYCEYTRR